MKKLQIFTMADGSKHKKKTTKMKKLPTGELG
jgi:hypothetical protein